MKTNKKAMLIDSNQTGKETETQTKKVMKKQTSRTSTEKDAILTSGGDAPGMNAVIAGFTRTCIKGGRECIGVINGFEGLSEGSYQTLLWEDVSDIRTRAGTILGTSRYPEFTNPEIRRKAIQNMLENGIKRLVVVGGNGSFHGAKLLAEEGLEFGIQVIGIGATIDKDINGTDTTIGFDTCRNYNVETILNIRNTACSHNRNFVIDPMGRHCSALTVECGLAVGADFILIPEVKFNFDEIAMEIQEMRRKKREKAILILVPEGLPIPEQLDIIYPKEVLDILKKCSRADQGRMKMLLSNRLLLESMLQTKLSASCYVSGELRKRGIQCYNQTIGYSQRGPNPVSSDILEGLKEGHFAFQLLKEGATNVAIVSQENKLTTIPFEEAIKPRTDYGEEYYELFKKVNQGYPI